MSKDIFKNAKWIGCGSKCQSPIIIRKFHVNDIKKAIIKLTGLGYFEAKINGKKICDDRYVPVMSDYEKRRTDRFKYPIYDETTHRIYYCIYDITELLHDGENVLEIQLGNGWYRQYERTEEGDTSFGEVLKAIYSIDIIDVLGKREVCSDGSETWSESEIIYNNLFIGEVWDCTREPKTEQQVNLLEPVDSIFTEQCGVPDRSIRVINPRLIWSSGNKKVYDAGENVSGIVKVYTTAPRGENIVLHYAENIHEDFSLNFHSTWAWGKIIPEKNRL